VKINFNPDLPFRIEHHLFNRPSQVGSDNYMADDDEECSAPVALAEVQNRLFS